MSDAADLINNARQMARESLARPGDWLDGPARLEAWANVRDSRTNKLDHARLAALSPTAVPGSHGRGNHLSAAAVEVVHRVGSDPGRLTRAWADAAMSELGEEIYTELVAVTATAVVLDTFDRVIGNQQASLPEAVAGEPARVRPDDVGDVGAWVSQSVSGHRANVSRAVSLVPVSSAAWRTLADSHYSRGADFMELRWSRALNRPQVELVASRTTALLECFY